MNSKTEELARQAGFNLDKLPDDVYLPLCAFADLLIKDCTGLIDQYSMMQLGTGMLTPVIRQTYGVK
jgi:hypothetical protein